MKKNLGMQIVVVGNGFVHVGNCSITDGFLRIDDAKNIRRWGTTKGLGQLASGPTKETIYDTAGTILVPLARVIFLIATDLWK